MALLLDEFSTLGEWMDNHMQIVKFGGHEQKFCPRTAFDAVAQRHVIEHAIAHDEDFFLGTQEEREFVENVCRNGRKLFAICVFCDLPLSCLKSFLDDNFTDAKLPLTDENCPKWLKKKRAARNAIFENQKRFNVPYFEMDSLHSLDDRYSMPMHFDESAANFRGSGAFGEVWKIWIHPDHCAFSSGANTKNNFAMKVIKQGQHEAREQNFHRAMATAGLIHPHLVKCFTSFTFGNKYHMVYELANCNLEEFIQKNPDAPQIPGLTDSALAQQLCGLASALQLIHTQGEPEPPREPGKLFVQEKKLGKTGYIHDVKPENILVFVYNGTLHWFRLSDFSCAKVVEAVATISGKRESYKTNSKSGTPIYQAPESLNNETSRPYDLWSLGCVYLELLVWYLDGYEELEAFRKSREGEVLPGGREDEGFFEVTGEDPNVKIKLRQPVVEKINDVLPRCGGDLKDIADTIPLLLEIDPKNRPTAAELMDQLQHLESDAGPEIESSRSLSLENPTMMQWNLPADDSDNEFQDLVVITRPSDER